MGDNNDWIFQDDWLSCMCAHYQQALLDGDTDNASGLRLLLDELQIPAQVIADIEAFAAGKLMPATEPVAELVIIEDDEDNTGEELPELMSESLPEPQPSDPITEAITEAPVQFAAMDAFPDTLAGLLPNPLTEAQSEPESDPLVLQKSAKPAKKPKPDKTQLSLF